MFFTSLFSCYYFRKSKYKTSVFKQTTSHSLCIESWCLHQKCASIQDSDMRKSWSGRSRNNYRPERKSGIKKSKNSPQSRRAYNATNWRVYRCTSIMERVVIIHKYRISFLTGLEARINGILQTAKGSCHFGPNLSSRHLINNPH